jgi:hypothetical protein
MSKLQEFLADYDNTSTKSGYKSAVYAKFYCLYRNWVLYFHDHCYWIVVTLSGDSKTLKYAKKTRMWMSV